MSEYAGNGCNAAFARDHDLVRGLNEFNAARVAQALEGGAGDRGSPELEFLLMALFRRDWRREIVRKRGRGQRTIPLNVLTPNEAWFQGGLPDDTRRELISGLKSGFFEIRKAVRGKTGRPTADFSAKLLLGFDLLKEMKRLTVEELQLSPLQANLVGIDSDLPRGIQAKAIAHLYRQRQKYAAPPDPRSWERYCLAAVSAAKAALRE